MFGAAFRDVQSFLHVGGHFEDTTRNPAIYLPAVKLKQMEERQHGYSNIVKMEDVVLEQIS